MWAIQRSHDRAKWLRLGDGLCMSKDSCSSKSAGNKLLAISACIGHGLCTARPREASSSLSVLSLPFGDLQLLICWSIIIGSRGLCK